MDDRHSNSAEHHDSRDSRTGQGEAARPRENRDQYGGEGRSLNPDIETIEGLDLGEGARGEALLDDDTMSMVDPGMGRERISANPDVLDLDESWRVEGEEPDFMQDPGTSDVIEAIEEGEPYFPPTDPPIRIEGAQDAEILGGFAATSIEEPTDDVDHPIRLLTNDEEIAERVRYALAADAYTGDLNINVEVEDGTVYLTGSVRSLDDVEQAEQIAGSVPGVEEVEEELEIV